MACTTLKRPLTLDPLLCSPSQRPKRRRCAPPIPSPPIALAKEVPPSPFLEVTPPLSKDLIASSIYDEMKKLQRRRQLPIAPSSSPSGLPPPNGESSTSSQAASSNANSPDKPLFSFHQVGLICERMLREREDKLRELYENELATKLCEQYDMFVKFTQDEIRKRLEGTPSYLS